MSEYIESNLPEASDLLVGSSVPTLSFKDVAVGEGYEGTVLSARTVQVRNYDDPTKLEFWDDGKPKLQIEVTLATEYADPTDPDDNGDRRVFLFGQKLRAAQDEFRKKGLKKLEAGYNFKIKLTGTKPSSNKRYADVKLYEIEINPATSDAAADALLSAGAKPVEAKGGKIAKLDAKQLKVAETLQSNGFTNDEIAENLGVSVDLVDASLTF
jgi:hypothetical protein